MKALFFKADVPRQRLTEALFNLDQVRSMAHYFDEKNNEYVHIRWIDGLEESFEGATAKNLWIAANENGSRERRN